MERTDANWTRQEPEAYPKEFRGMLGTILLLENMSGLVCNILVLVTYHFGRKSEIANPISDKSISNVYLTNLNIVDMLICLTAVPLTFVHVTTPRFHQPIICFLHEAAISFASSASAVNILVISVNRYETIVKPLRRATDKGNIKYVMAAIWVVTLMGLGSPFLGLLSPDGASGNSTGVWSSSVEHPWFVRMETGPGSRAYYQLYHVILYILTNGVMVICYSRICQAARTRVNIRMALARAALVTLPERTSSGHRFPTAKCSPSKQEKTVTKMTFLIVATFMVCWAPHSVVTIAFIILGNTYRLEMLQISCLALAYLSPLLHPLLYAFMRRNFRRAFRETLPRKRNARVMPEAVAQNTSCRPSGSNNTTIY